MRFWGWVEPREVGAYIRAADVCLAPVRPLGAVVSNEQDVWKVGEYAAFGKPVVVTGMAPSPQYHLARSPGEFVELVAKGLRGLLPRPEPRFWEEYSAPRLLEAYDSLR
jgi:glycosyltransferase involved in cell wall biosynthesis